MEEKGGGQGITKNPDGNGGGQYDANGQPITDYMTKYDMSNEQFQKMKEKFGKRDRDFIQPSTDAEKEYVLD